MITMMMEEEGEEEGRGEGNEQDGPWPYPQYLAVAHKHTHSSYRQLAPTYSSIGMPVCDIQIREDDHTRESIPQIGSMEA